MSTRRLSRRAGTWKTGCSLYNEMSNAATVALCDRRHSPRSCNWAYLDCQWHNAVGTNRMQVSWAGLAHRLTQPHTHRVNQGFKVAPLASNSRQQLSPCFCRVVAVAVTHKTTTLALWLGAGYRTRWQTQTRTSRSLRRHAAWRPRLSCSDPTCRIRPATIADERVSHMLACNPPHCPRSYNPDEWSALQPPLHDVVQRWQRVFCRHNLRRVLGTQVAAQCTRTHSFM